MRLFLPSFEIINQKPGLSGIWKAAELPGRICYGSLDKMTEDSAKPFVDRLMSANHGAPLEHATVYLVIPYATGNLEAMEYWVNPENWEYCRINNDKNDEKLYVSTNLRVLFERGRMDDLQYQSEYVDGKHTRRVMVKFTTNIGVTREYNRHRHNSMNEESTRYCNYGKEKFGGGLNVLYNMGKFEGREEDMMYDVNKYTYKDFAKMIADGKEDEFDDLDIWVASMKFAEWAYLKLTGKHEWKAQDARDVLPLNTKSALIHTAFVDDWEHFFDLRAKGTTGAPHPQAKELAEPLMEEFINKGYIKK